MVPEFFVKAVNLSFLNHNPRASESTPAYPQQLTNQMSRRGRRYQDDKGDEAGGWGRTSSSRRINGDYSSLSASSMTRELDDLMRIIEADWSVVTTPNVAHP